jgi:cytochrome c553
MAKFNNIITFNGAIALAIATILPISKVLADPKTDALYIAVVETWEIKNNNKSIYCGGPINDKYLSGTIEKIGDEVLFTPLSDMVRKLKIERRTATEKKVLKLNKKLVALNKRIKAENQLCKNGPTPQETATPTATFTLAPVESPTPIPTATYTPIPATPSPTATPTPEPTGFFDDNGNVTKKGKEAFQIPLEISANVSAGSTVFRSSCRSCHGIEFLDRTFTEYKTRTSNPPMNLNKTDQELADLTAYLNRNRTAN